VEARRYGRECVCGDNTMINFRTDRAEIRRRTETSETVGKIQTENKKRKKRKRRREE
jgi:hypothetical protein